MGNGRASTTPSRLGERVVTAAIPGSGCAPIRVRSRSDTETAISVPDVIVAGRVTLSMYGGIYIAASLVWLWLIEGQTATRTDLLGAALAISGALIIIGFAARLR